MDYRQKKIYTAFMESVCNEFNCMQALPALKEGFRALCEAVGGDNKGYVYAQGWFESSTPLWELTAEEVSRQLKWTKVPDSSMDCMKNPKLDADRVLVDEPENCLVVSGKGKASRPGMYKYFAQGMKAEGSSVGNNNADGKILVYAQNWFESPTPLDELTEGEISNHLSYWTERMDDMARARSIVERAKSEADRVVVDTPDKCFVVEEKGSPSKSGMYKYFARGMKFETKDDFDLYKRVEDGISDLEREDMGRFGGHDDFDSEVRNYRHPTSPHFSTGSFRDLENDDLEGRKNFGDYLGFGKDRDPRKNPKPPKGWDGDDDIEGRRDFGDYLGFDPGRDPRKNPKRPKGWLG